MHCFADRVVQRTFLNNRFIADFDKCEKGKEGVIYPALQPLLIVPAQRLAEFGRKVPHRKRLLDEIDARVQYAVVGDDIGRIARHEQAFEVRIQGQEIFGQVPAVHLGHDHIGHEQMDFTGVRLRQSDGLTGVLAASTV